MSIKKRISFISIFFFSLFLLLTPEVIHALPYNPVQSPQAEASCSPDGKLTITMTPQDPNHKYFSIKIQPRSDKPSISIRNYTEKTLTRDVTSGDTYWYYVLTVAKNGQSSDPQGGYGSIVECKLKSPNGLTATYSDSYVTLSWKPVKDATKYMIRVDNTINPWNGPQEDYIPSYDRDINELIAAYPPNEGDHVLNALKETKFKFKASPNRKIIWWVYAVGQRKYDISEKALATTDTKGNGETVTPSPTPTLVPTKTSTPSPTQKITPTPTSRPTITPSVSPSPSPVYEQPKVTISCSSDTFKLELPTKPSPVWDHWAIRVDDGRNPWGGVDVTHPGDVLQDNFKGSIYQQSLVKGVKYSWWTHSIDKNGAYNYPKGDYSGEFHGEFTCPVPPTPSPVPPSAPVNLISQCDTDPMVFSWAPVEGAVSYAVRVDDLANDWNGDTPNTHDRVINGRTSTSLEMAKVEGHSYNWWVHAVDSRGNYSPAAWASCVK